MSSGEPLWPLALESLPKDCGLNLSEVLHCTLLCDCIATIDPFTQSEMYYL